MSKRQIEVQGTKDGTSFLGDGSASANADDVPKRATAAQLANRKLRSIKQPTSRKQTSGSQSNIQGGISQGNPFGQVQQGTPPLAFGSQQQNAPQQSSSFGFQPQQQGGGMFGGTTSSFPPAQSATPGSSFVNSSFPAFGAGANANANTGFGFNPTPPTASDSSFSAPGPNPFAATNTNPALNTPASGAFSGSIFNLAAPQPAAAPPAENTAPANPQALASPFKFGATSASNAPSPSIFGQTAQTSGAIGPSSNLFGTSTPSTAPNSSIFGQGNAPTTPFSTNLEKKVSSPDEMQTSPDYSPSKPTSPAVNTSQPSGTSLFERITPADPKPQDTPRQSVETPQAGKPTRPTFGSFGQTPVAKETPSAGNPFANIARTPSPAKETAPPRPAEDSKTANPFSKLHPPLDKPGRSTPSPAFSQPSNIFGQQPAPTPSVSLSKPSEPVPSPSKQQPPSSATTTKAPSFTLPPTGAPILGMPSTSFAPPKSSPLKFSTPVDVTPPSSNRNSVIEAPTVTPTSTANVFGISQGQAMFSSAPSINKSSSDGTTDSVGYDPVTGKVTRLDVRNATLADMEKMLEDGPGPDADDLSKEIWCEREKLRLLNVGFKNTINHAGVYANWTRYTDWYAEVAKEISTRLVTARRKKTAIDEANSGPMNPSVKRKADPKAEAQQEDPGTVAKKSKNVEGASVPQKTVSQTSKSLEEVLNGGSAASSPRPTFNQPSVSQTSKSLEDILNGGSAAPSPRPSSTQPSNSFSTSTPAAPSNSFLGSVSTAADSSRPSGQAANNRPELATSAPKFPLPSTSSGFNQSTFNPFNSQNKAPVSNLFSSPSNEAASNSFTPVSKDPGSSIFNSAFTTSQVPAPASNSFNFASNSASKEPVTSNSFASFSKEATSNTGSSTSLFQKSTNAAQTPTASFKPSTTFSTGNPPATAPPAFSVKPLPAAATNGIQMPKFSLGSGTPNFMQQFAKNAQSAEEILAEEKKKAMRDLPEPDDSDYEEELAEFEEKWEKEQSEKRAKQAAASSKAPVFQFTPSGSNASSDSEAPAKAPFSLARPSSAASSNGLFVSRNNSPTPSTNGGASVFDTPAAQSTPFANIFGHLSGGESGADAAGDDDDEDEGETEGSDDQESNGATPIATQQSSTKRKEIDEQSEEDTFEESVRRKRQDRTPQAEKQIESTQTPVPPKGKSMFDRVTYLPDGQPERELSTPEDGKANGESETPKATLFGSSAPPPSALFQPKASLSGDQTFNRDSRIKFSSTAPATFNFTTTSPANGKNLFGSLTSSTPAPPNAASAQSLLAAPSTAFGLPSGFNSPFMSRAATPFSADEASGKESGDASGKNNDEDKLTDAQVQLTDLTETEKRENDVLFECEKSKALEHDKGSKNPGGSWENKGLGPVRILKNKQTGVVSLLQRQVPGGRIVVNVRILPGIPATGAGKSVKVPVPASDDRPGTWCFRFGTEEIAVEFMNTWNENRPA